MKKIIILCGLSAITITSHSELVLVSGQAKQKNYIDTASIFIQSHPKVVTYNTLVFFDHNFEIEKFRNSVAVKTSRMNCNEKTWYTLSDVRKTWDQKKVIEILPVSSNASTAKPVVNSGPVKYIYDHYCR